MPRRLGAVFPCPRDREACTPPHDMTEPRFPRTALFALVLSASAFGQSRTYTLDADFSEGTLINVNTNVPDQLQLNAVGETTPLPFINVPATLRGTLVRIDVDTGNVIGEYRTAPDTELRGPSRTAVDSKGNVWVGNRDFNVGGDGTVVKIGVVIGGTRVNSDGTPNPNGEYLAPPYQYNTCIDRDGDGLIRTSRGLGDILDWPNINDLGTGANGLVQDAFDECILIYKRVSGEAPRHLSVDADDDVWVGGYPFLVTTFDLLSGEDGSVLDTFDATTSGCGGHGGLTDSNGIVWSTSLIEGSLMRFDPSLGTSTCIPVLRSFGLAIDTQGNLWNSQFDQDTIVKLSPSGAIEPGFPMTTGGASNDRSVAITPVDDHVWVANSGGNDVSRLDNAGNVLKVISLGADGMTPTGLSVDSNGRVWAVCRDSSTAKRIDPSGDGDGLGIVDMTVDLGANADPTALSDMTGQVPLRVFQNAGSWNVVYDSGVPDSDFRLITTTEQLFANTAISVFVRAANEASDLTAQDFVAVTSSVPFFNVIGRHAEILVEFTRADPLGQSPILFDLTIEAEGGGGGEDLGKIVGSRRPGSLLLYPEYDNRQGVVSLLTLTNTAPGTFLEDSVRVEFVYRGRYGFQGEELDCSETNVQPTFTFNDTLTVMTSIQNPNDARGFVYAFAKNHLTNEPIVHNHLAGSMLIVNGFNTIEYSINPFSYLGVGKPGESTDKDGDPLRDLNGIEYSQSADEILIPRFLGQSPKLESELVLLNLSGGTAFSAVVDFLIYNDNEEVFSHEHEFQCWQKIPLAEISSVFTQEFLANESAQDPQEIGGAAGLESGWFRMNGDIAQSFFGEVLDPAIVGFLVETVRGRSAADLPFESGCQANGDLYGTSLFGDVVD